MVFWDWFVPLAASPWLQAVTGGILVVLVVAGLVAHLPIRMPGPLTATERANQRTSQLNGFVSLIPFVLVVAAILATGFLLLPPRTPFDVQLISRTRPIEAACPELEAQVSPHQVKDLGPLVDQVLAECERRGATSWVTDHSADRAAARSVLLEVARNQQLSEGLSRVKPPELPSWLIRSVEFSLVSLVTRQQNIRRVTVAAGYETPIGWPLASTTLQERGRAKIHLVDQLTTRPDPLQVIRLTGAQLTANELLAWAVVQGRFAPQQTGFKLRLQLIEDRTSRTLPEQELKPDSVECRVFKLLLPRPASLAEKSELYLATAQGDCQVRVSRPGVLPPPPRINFQGEHAEKWVQLIREAPNRPEYTRELEMLHLPIPQAVSTGGLVFLSTSDAAVLSPSEVVAREVLQGANRDSTPQRVIMARDGPPTVFSWQSLPASPNPQRELTQEIVWARSTTNQRTALVAEGYRNGQRYVLFRAEAARPSSRPEIFTDLARVRSLAWAAAQLSANSRELPAHHPSESRSQFLDPPPCPLLTEADLDQLTARTLRQQDSIILLVVGCYLAVLLGRAFRYLPKQ